MCAILLLKIGIYLLKREILLLWSQYTCMGLDVNSVGKHGICLNLLKALATILLWPYSPLLGPGRFFTFLILYTVGRTPQTGDQPVIRPLPTHRTTQTQNKHTYVHNLIGIRTHNACGRASEDSSYRRLCSHCDRHNQRHLPMENIFFDVH
jgi:hypothetical protein